MRAMSYNPLAEKAKGANSLRRLREVVKKRVLHSSTVMKNMENIRICFPILLKTLRWIRPGHMITFSIFVNTDRSQRVLPTIPHLYITCQIHVSSIISVTHFCVGWGLSCLFLKINYYLVELKPHGCMMFFSSCGEWGILSSCRVWTLGVRASVVAAHRISSCGTWS